jgi:hypothetical protein
MVWAADAHPDTFRIKIWYVDGSGEHVVYDNGTNLPLLGGAIEIRQ